MFAVRDLIAGADVVRRWFSQPVTNEGNLAVRPKLVWLLFNYLIDDSTAITSFPLVCRQWRDVKDHHAPQLRGCDRLKELLPQIAKDGHVGLLGWALTWVKYRKHDPKVYEIAVLQENLAILTLALQSKLKYDLHICNLAAANGKLEALKLLVKWRVPSADICKHAAGAGQLKILDWAWEQTSWWWGWRFEETCYFEAVKRGHAVTIAWLYLKKVPWKPEILYQAAFYGWKEIIEWGRQQKVKGWDPLDSDLCEAAAKGGHFDLIIWLNVKCGYIWGDRTMMGAVYFGDCKFFVKLYEEACPWKSRLPAIEKAVELEKIEILRECVRLQIISCSDIRNLAARSKSVSVLNWVNCLEQKE